MDGQTYIQKDAGHWSITIAHPEHVVLTWAKNKMRISMSIFTAHEVNIIYWTKVKTLHFCFLSKWPKSVFYFNFFLYNKMFLFCKIKCLTSCYQLPCTYVSSKWKPKHEIFTCDFILFLKNNKRANFYLEYMCSVFTFVQYIWNHKHIWLLIFQIIMTWIKDDDFLFKDVKIYCTTNAQLHLEDHKIMVHITYHPIKKFEHPQHYFIKSIWWPLDPFPNNPWFSQPWAIGLLKTLWEKEKMLVTSIFSHFDNVFLNTWDRNYYLTLSQTSPGFYVSAVQFLWKHCGKRRNCNKVFSTHLENFLPFLSNLKLLSANSFTLEESKICCLGKG